MVDTNPSYRNNRQNFYADKSSDTIELGTVIQVLKSTKDSFDHNYIPIDVPNNAGSKSYATKSGSGSPESNPVYQYPGYLYCDGAEYYIKDYPGLYSIIGNSYGGTASNGITITNQGSGYPSTTTVSFTAAPSGGVTATGTVTVVSGKITAVSITNSGEGYTTAPTATFTGSGGSGVTYEIRMANGSIQPVTPITVFEVWPDTNMGTFNVPDLLAKKIVGNGSVYGTGTATIGNVSLSVGKSSIGGKWYLDKDAQKKEFSLGQITTTGYSDVSDRISSQLIGSQTVKISMEEKRLQGPAQHAHFLLHSYAPESDSYPRKDSGDEYLKGYKPSTGKILSFSPSGGLALSHKHALVKRPLTNANVGTYDVYNYTGGDSGTGTLKDSTAYYASGDSAAGTYELVTSAKPSLSSIFISTSKIGGRSETIAGTPTYEFSSTTTYTTAQTGTTVAFPASYEVIKVKVLGAGGSGAVYSTAGNSGGSSSVTIGSSVTITAGGGGGGGASNGSSGGAKGSTGTVSVTGSSATTISYSSTTTTYTGTAGGSGPNYVYSNSTAPSGLAGVGDINVEFSSAGYGGAGNYYYVTNITTVGPTTYTTNQTVTLSTGGGQAAVTETIITLKGAQGGNATGLPDSWGCDKKGGYGKVMTLQVSSPNAYKTFDFYFGTKGAVTSAGTGGNGADGGSGGEGSGNQAGYVNSGAGGGAGSSITIGANTRAGAAGGGGCGGSGYTATCGTTNIANSPDAPQAITSNIFPASGKPGTRFICNGGGGGGGGGGYGSSSDVNSAGGYGGGGGGNGGEHNYGIGGARGKSAYNSSYFTLVSSENTNTGAGSATVTYKYDASYWTAGGGGGGAGAFVSAYITKEDLSSASSLSLTVGSGGSAVTAGGTTSTAGAPGYVSVQFGTITGYTGGTTTTTVGDIVESASAGINIYTTGSGSTATGGFKLPTTQAPTIVFDGGSGSGATATATVSGNVVTGITKTASGTGYTSTPVVRFLGGVGGGTRSTITLNGSAIGTISLVANSSKQYTKYVKFGGTQLNRYIILTPVDCTEVKYFSIKVARGNGKNGGNRPENGGDELKLYYNTDNSNSFPAANFLSTIVPLPTDAEVTSNYDGDGTTSGSETLWYTYTYELTQPVQTSNVKFKISQERNSASEANDNAADSDHFGICEFLYEYNVTTKLEFVPSEGGIATSSDELIYQVEGPSNSVYPSGSSANDVKFTLSASQPLIPVASINPDIQIPLLEPYHLVKHLIKAF